MPRPSAVLVEDNIEQLEFSRAILEGVGYLVRTFIAAAPALEEIRRPEFSADLFVLDRRLPVDEGGLDADEVGDDLLAEVRSRFPDARIIVFTGFATISQVQSAMANTGQIPTGDGSTIDRITVFQKEQSIEFRSAVAEHASVLQRLNDIEVVPSAADGVVDALASRVLKRVALAYGATTVRAKSLGGGMSHSSVWSCELRDAHNQVAAVVVKDVSKPDQLTGLAPLLPAAMALSTLATLSGLTNGRFVNVMRAAGSGSVSLLEVVASDPSKAIELITPVARALGAVPANSTSKRLDEIIAVYVDYAEMATRLESLGLDSPSPSMQVSVSFGWRHGDLHPANVLIVDDSAALIDFDSECVAGSCADLIALQLSTLVHPESPIRGKLWPDVTEIETTLGTGGFGAGHSCAVWFAGIHGLIEELGAGRREVWGTTLAYSVRQLKYPDVQNDPETFERVVALIRRASAELDSC